MGKDRLVGAAKGGALGLLIGAAFGAGLATAAWFLLTLWRWRRGVNVIGDPSWHANLCMMLWRVSAAGAGAGLVVGAFEGALRARRVPKLTERP